MTALEEYNQHRKNLKKKKAKKDKLCPKCGVNLKVEAEMFSHDKLYKKHSCGKEKI